jgi:hypothetical protein
MLNIVVFQLQTSVNSVLSKSLIATNNDDKTRFN